MYYRSCPVEITDAMMPRLVNNLRYDLVSLVRHAKNLFLSGRPGIGKTTVVREVLKELDWLKVGGFYTEEIRRNGARTGFLVKTFNGKLRVLSKIGFASPVRVGPYGVDLQAIEEVINPAIEKGMEQSDILILDEIGKMEIVSPRFRELVEKALDSRRRVLATVPCYYLPFVAMLKRRSDVFVAEVTRDNRNAWPVAILKGLRLQSGNE
ncbi:MAG: NTPase [Candidatus Omnitrophica bacterium]|nr:NTPase [Candidatus Omnitrophota bacterium]